jgi:predicted MFS family arabinose efflux permease
VAAVFTATPFLIPDIATRLDIPVGLSGLISTAQVGGFAVATFLAGRLLRPRRRFHFGAIGVVAVSTAASAATTNFALLAGSRLLAGAGMGILTWIAWAEAARFPRGFGEVAAVAPVTTTIASPLIGWLIERGGYSWVFWFLAGFAVLAGTFSVDFGDLAKVGRQTSGSRSNRLLLACLFLLTTFGSAVFIFSGATGAALQGLSPVEVSWAFSVNAVTGVAATRMVASRRTGGLWLTGSALSALVIGLVSSKLVFFAAMAVWGFSFWIGVPAVFRLLAERSLTPAERVGDAQALMALGRVVGPLIGGTAVGAGEFARLSVVGALGLGSAAGGISAVELYRAKNPK